LGSPELSRVASKGRLGDRPTPGNDRLSDS